MRWSAKFIACAAGMCLSAGLALAGLTDLEAASATDSASGDPVIAAVGDMACDPADPKFAGGAGTSTNCAQLRVSDQVVADSSIDAVLGLGDFQYDCGDPADYAASYDPTWGRLDALMWPTVGNHEYKTGPDVYGAPCPADNSTAQSYFNRFGAVAHQESRGRYSFDIGAWHLISMNGNCTPAGGCSAKSTPTVWLKKDLAATTQPCIAAFWHQPLWTGAGTGVAATYRAWWNALYAAHADVVFNGHRHNYQRFAPMDPTGAIDQAAGLTEYVAGTGGEALVSLAKSAVPQPVAYRKTFGYLRVTLHPAGWDAQFVNAAGTVLDTSSGACHP